MWRARHVSWLLVGTLTGAILAISLCAWFSSVSGFPLDDSWIHQDFARTLATTGQFAFLPGKTAAGETSPLWMLLLTPPYLLTGGQPPIWVIVVWSDLLDVITLTGLAWTAGTCAQLLAEQRGATQHVQQLSRFLAIAAILTEWHLTWSAASGMETILFAWLVLLVLLFTEQRKHPALIGFLVSVALGVRPESWLLFVIVLMVSSWFAWRRHLWRSWARSWAIPFVVAFMPGAVLYIFFNIFSGGSLVPTTFLAKSGEFNIGPQSILSWVLWLFLGLFLTSPILIFLPGLTLCGRLVDKEKPHGPHPLLFWLLWAWSIALLLAFASRVNPNYQHSRYLLPALPPLLILASMGAAPVLLSSHRILARYGFLILVIVAFIGLGRSATTYQGDVQEVACTQVDTGIWLRDHLPPGMAVATHDVGAIGYFSNHPVVDVAGLVDPELIPLLHNPESLVHYLQVHQVEYAALVPSWYPELVQDLHGTVVYNGCAPLHMNVYQTG